MKKNVMLWTRAGQIGLAIVRRTGDEMKIILGGKNFENAQSMASLMNTAGFDVIPVQMDLASREDILRFIETGKQNGPVTKLISAAGVSPSQASVDVILKAGLFGTAVLLEEVGKIIEEGGCGVHISSQSGFRMPQLTAEEDEQMACTPAEDLLNLKMLQPENVKDSLHAYLLAKRCNEKRVMFEAVRWGKREA